MNGPPPDRLYYENPYLTEFQAQVTEQLEWGGHPAVVLNQTAFYPTSGGQPSDRGEICGIPVIGVEERETDAAVIHLLDSNLTTDRGAGRVDWARRFDHMQQHTGQHLLSAAFEQLLDANTVAFHLGSDLCTIDLDKTRLSTEAIAPVERLVNQVIWEDRPVITRYASPDELPDISFRRPQKVPGPIRLVEITDFDLNPCGGTHVARTGEIGLLKVIRPDYRGEETRIEFVCGQRALQDYDVKNRTLLQLASRMSVGYWELDDALTRLEEESKQARRELRVATEHMAEHEAAALIQQAEEHATLKIVQQVWETRDPGELRALAQKAIEHPNVVAMLASLGERIHLCFARSEDLAVDAAALLRTACEQLGGKGGGQPHFAQGSAPATDRSRVEEILESLSHSI